jgi:hypothetical protein
MSVEKTSLDAASQDVYYMIASYFDKSKDVITFMQLGRYYYETFNNPNNERCFKDVTFNLNNVPTKSCLFVKKLRINIILTKIQCIKLIDVLKNVSIIKYDIIVKFLPLFSKLEHIHKEYNNVENCSGEKPKLQFVCNRMNLNTICFDVKRVILFIDSLYYIPVEFYENLPLVKEVTIYTNSVKGIVPTECYTMSKYIYIISKLRKLNIHVTTSLPCISTDIKIKWNGKKACFDMGSDCIKSRFQGGRISKMPNIYLSHIPNYDNITSLKITNATIDLLTFERILRGCIDLEDSSNRYPLMESFTNTKDRRYYNFFMRKKFVFEECVIDLKDIIDIVGTLKFNRCDCRSIKKIRSANTVHFKNCSLPEEIFLGNSNFVDLVNIPQIKKLSFNRLPNHVNTINCKGLCQIELNEAPTGDIPFHCRNESHSRIQVSIKQDQTIKLKEVEHVGPMSILDYGIKPESKVERSLLVLSREIKCPDTYSFDEYNLMEDVD